MSNTTPMRNLALNSIQMASTLLSNTLRELETLYHNWSVISDLFLTQTDTLQAIIKLCDENFFKECFSLLRTVFEGSFFLRLVMNGQRFLENRKYYVTPITSPNVRTARDRTLEKWRQDIREDPEKGNWQFNRKGEDAIIVTSEHEGHFDDNGVLVTRYYFAYEQFDPELRFTARLPTVQEYAEVPDPEVLEQQQNIYNRYFYIRHLVVNLMLNNFLTEEQRDRFWVHYNFLSAFVHPSKLGTPRRSIWEYPGDRGPLPEEAYVELILSYVCHLMALLLSWTTEFITRINPQTEVSDNVNQIGMLQDAAQDLWFIYNEPTLFDTERSEVIRRQQDRGTGPTISSAQIGFPPNPLKRLIDMRRVTRTPYKQ